MTLPTTPLTDAEIENLANQPRAYALTNAKVLATITSLQGELQRTRDALHDFLDNPLFQVAVGGNPIRVEAMIAKARALLTPPTGESK